MSERVASIRVIFSKSNRRFLPIGSSKFCNWTEPSEAKPYYVSGKVYCWSDRVFLLRVIWLTVFLNGAVSAAVAETFICLIWSEWQKLTRWRGRILWRVRLVHSRSSIFGVRYTTTMPTIFEILPHRSTQHNLPNPIGHLMKLNWSKIGPLIVLLIKTCETGNSLPQNYSVIHPTSKILGMCRTIWLAINHFLINCRSLWIFVFALYCY